MIFLLILIAFIQILNLLFLIGLTNNTCKIVESLYTFGYFLERDKNHTNCCKKNDECEIL